MDVDRGSAVTIEVNVEKYTPRTGYDLFDPTSITIAIENDQGETVVSATAMTSDGSTGLYSYTVQTLSTWKVGQHDAIITVTDTVNEKERIENVFKLG